MTSGAFQSKEMSLKMLFRVDSDNKMRTRFKIPDYQRVYEWKADKEVRKLLEDIDLAVERRSDFYFLSTITTGCEDDSSPDNDEIVIDGQQRLITLSIVIRRLLDKAIELKVGSSIQENWGLTKYLFIDGKEKNPVLVLHNHDDVRCMKNVLTLDSSVCPEKNSKIYNANEVVKKFLNVRFKTDTGKEDLTQWVEILTENFILVKQVCYRLEYACQIFDAINNRGRSLTSYDVIKSQLYLILFQSQYKEEFEKGIVEAENSVRTSLSNGSFSKNMRQLVWMVMQTEYPRNKEPHEHKNFPTHYVAEDNLCTKFDRDVLDSGRDRVFNALAFVKKCSDDNNLKIFSTILHKNSFISHMPSIDLSAVRRYQFSQIRDMRVIQPMLFSGIYARSKSYITKDEFSDIINDLFVMWRYRELSNKRASSLQEGFAELAYILRKNKSGDFKGTLITYLKKMSLDLFGVDSNSILTANPHFPKKESKEILMDIAVFESSKGMFGFQPDKATLEHITPQDKKAIKEKNGYDLSEDEYLAYLDFLGNLTLLWGPDNSASGNRPFKEKLQQYKKGRISGVDHFDRLKILFQDIGEPDQDDPKWTSDKIVARGKKLIEHYTESMKYSWEEGYENL